ncbi:TRAP transporter small permease [Octadecabacter sp. 1_MG-2023]|uniref:TRAP transporter small permease subunit n=1 Tax=unclassified Octadecabacter TaxID=196158 RepID=UPI001C0808BE|nr:MULTISPECIES: TRAP transporter small permease [unclassified Octadecabacter]MBU2994017.1 TRAP transporter small permease [Octadecabacter sp. B2R22]MDO6736040.1 TRAP transporter small permease [Octadecabacter sp. 1_MG-2023]
MSSEKTAQGSVIGRLNRGLIPIEDLANLLAAVAIMALMFLGVAQIVLRTVFNNPIDGYIDLVELSMASMAFLGAAYTQRMGSHIRMELLMSRLSGRSLWAVEAFGAAVAMFIIGVLVYYSYGHFLRAYTLGDTTIDAEYPVWPSKLLVPIAFSIWWCRLALQFFGALRLVVFPQAEPVGVVVMKDVAEQAQDEIHEVMGDDVDFSDPEGTA